MTFNVRLRKLLDRIRWPLVTRARFELNKENYEAEIVVLGQINNNYKALMENGEYGELRRQLSEAREKLCAGIAEVAELKAQLEEARKNDHRNPDTGRFEKAPQ